MLISSLKGYQLEGRGERDDVITLNLEAQPAYKSTESVVQSRSLNFFVFL